MYSEWVRRYVSVCVCGGGGKSVCVCLWVGG